MIEKTEAFMAAELRCEIATAKLQVANRFRWGYAALFMLAVKAQVAFPFAGIAAGLLALYFAPFTYRRELKRASTAFEKVAGVQFQAKGESAASL